LEKGLLFGYGHNWFVLRRLSWLSACTTENNMVFVQSTYRVSFRDS